MIRIHIDPKLSKVIDLWRLAYVSWALREISPTHPDVPELVLRRAELERKLS